MHVLQSHGKMGQWFRKNAAVRKLRAQGKLIWRKRNIKRDKVAAKLQARWRGKLVRADDRFNFPKHFAARKLQAAARRRAAVRLGDEVRNDPAFVR